MRVPECLPLPDVVSQSGSAASSSSGDLEYMADYYKKEAARYQDRYDALNKEVFDLKDLIDQLRQENRELKAQNQKMND